MSLEETAQRLINKRGRTITLVSPSVVSEDVDKPWRGPEEVTTEKSLKAVFEEREQSELGGALAALVGAQRRSGTAFYVAALDLAGYDVEKTQSITDGGRAWRVVAVKAIAPGDTAYIYRLEVKQ